MKKILTVTAFVLYTNLLPYICRLPRGVDWAAQYVPDEGCLLLGLLFFGAFASLPAVPLIIACSRRKHVPVAFSVSCIVTTGLLCYWHHDYDLASDAQAAIGLVFIPIYTAGIAAVVASAIGALEVTIKKRVASK